MAQACALSRVALTQPHPGPHCRHQQRCIALTSPRRRHLALVPPEVVRHSSGTEVLTGFLPHKVGAQEPLRYHASRFAPSPRHRGTQRHRNEKKERRLKGAEGEEPHRAPYENFGAYAKTTSRRRNGRKTLAQESPSPRKTTKDNNKNGRPKRSSKAQRIPERKIAVAR